MRPVLIDFGVSKHYDEKGNATSRLLSGGYTPGYAPVEQYRGVSVFSPTADVYALGATLYFLLTEENPVDAVEIKPADVAARLSAIVGPQRASVIAGTMSYHPSSRPADAGELLKLLKGGEVATPENNEKGVDEGTATVLIDPEKEAKVKKAKVEKRQPKKDKDTVLHAVAAGEQKSRKGLYFAVAGIVAVAAGLAIAVVDMGQNTGKEVKTAEVAPTLAVADTALADVTADSVKMAPPAEVDEKPEVKREPEAKTKPADAPRKEKEVKPEGNVDASALAVYKSSINNLHGQIAGVKATCRNVAMTGKLSPADRAKLRTFVSQANTLNMNASMNSILDAGSKNRLAEIQRVATQASLVLVNFKGSGNDGNHNKNGSEKPHVNPSGQP